MSEAIKKIQEYILYQEQWSRSTLTTLSTSGFEEIDAILKELSPNDYDEVQEFCEQQLQKNRNSIYALYISGILSMERNTLNDDLLTKLLDIFTDNHKWNIVEFIAKKVLDYRNNLQALRKLAIVYEVADRHNEIIPIWEQIVRIDYEEAEILLKLAKINQDKGDINLALKDYTKAINRYLHQKNYAQIKKIWTILIAHNPQDIDFYISYINKIERILTLQRATELMELLYKQIKKSDAVDDIILILKNLLRLQPDNDEYRSDLVDTYKRKHKDNPKLNDFIKTSNLANSWRNASEAISDFEKHISFYPGSFVNHSKWGIGRIKEATHQSLAIDFAKKRNHQMEISMAVNSLTALAGNHFWVLRSITSKEKLKQHILENPFWGLKRIITSLDGADIKKIKSELVPSLLTTSEWNSWSVKARKILHDNPNFGSKRDKSDYYIFSEKALSPVEKFYGIFTKEDNFLTKIKLIRKALGDKIFEDISVDEDLFFNVLGYFSSFVNTTTQEEEYNEQFINSLFVCEETARAMPSSEYHMHFRLEDFIPNMPIELVKQVIKLLRINDYKDMFLTALKQYRDDWRELFIYIVPYYHNNTLITSLEAEDETELLQNIYLHIQKNITDYKAGFIWFSTHLHEKAWFKEIITEFKLASDLLRTAILLHRDIQNRYQVPVNKRLFNNVEVFLFESGRIESLIENESMKNINYIYSLINTISDALLNRVLNLRDTILRHHPTFDFRDQFDFEQASSTGFLTLSQSYDDKKKILQRIHEHDVPANSKEIEKARAYGDLKENAEYKAALEHQEILNSRVAQLKKEIEQARIFDDNNLSLSSVGFATKIELLNTDDNSTKEYTILGPWESNPDKNVISYLSPLGKKLYKKKLDENITYIINEISYNVRIAKIIKGI